MLLNLAFEPRPRSLGFSKANDSARRHVSYNIVNNTVLHIKIIKIYVTKTYSKIGVDKYFTEAFGTKNGFKYGDASLPLLSNSFLKYAIKNLQETPKGLGMETYISF
jgi:hypothetical protein